MEDRIIELKNQIFQNSDQRVIKDESSFHPKHKAGQIVFERPPRNEKLKRKCENQNGIERKENKIIKKRKEEAKKGIVGTGEFGFQTTGANKKDVRVKVENPMEQDTFGFFPEKDECEINGKRMTKENFYAVTVANLRRILKNLNLRVGGVKTDLIDRIWGAISDKNVIIIKYHY